jgi:hypothetical protein
VADDESHPAINSDRLDVQQVGMRHERTQHRLEILRG